MKFTIASESLEKSTAAWDKFLGENWDLLSTTDVNTKDLVVRNMQFSQTNNYIISVICVHFHCIAGLYEGNQQYRQTVRENLDAVEFENHIVVRSQVFKDEDEDEDEDEDGTNSDIQELFQ